MEDLVADAVAIIEQTGAAPCHFVGLSTGGFVGMRLALHRPDLMRSVVLMGTSAEAEPLRNRIKYRPMFLALRVVGFGSLLDTTMKLMFGRRSRWERARSRRTRHRRTQVTTPLQMTGSTTPCAISSWPTFYRHPAPLSTRHDLDRGICQSSELTAGASERVCGEPVAYTQPCGRSSRTSAPGDRLLAITGPPLPPNFNVEFALHRLYLPEMWRFLLQGKVPARCQEQSIQFGRIFFPADLDLVQTRGDRVRSELDP